MRFPFGRRGREEKADGDLLHALGKEGCPSCHLSARNDEQHFFWFFNENYYEPHTVDALERSLGFCLAHTDLLVRTGVGGAQLAAVFEVLAGRIRGTLSPKTGAGSSRRDPAVLREAARCPACQSRYDQEGRATFWLTHLLEQPGRAGHYGQPGLLCFPHLQRLLPRLSAPALRSLLAIHATAMTTAAASVSEIQAAVRRAPAEERRDPVKALLPALHLVVGHERDTGAYPRLDEEHAAEPSPGSVANFMAACQAAACPICLEQRRAWLEWVRWLDVASATRPIEDLLPTCPAHVWAVIHRGGAFLALRVVEQVLGRMSMEVRVAAESLDPPQRPPRTALGRLREAIDGPRRRFRQARAFAARPVECPVCSRLALAASRSLALLFRLLEDPRHREWVLGGYGLCLQHLARAVALAPAHEMVAQLAAIERARLASLHWELEEALRKSSWQFRPEEKGPEQTAWRRALLRFSGSLRATWS